MAIIHGNINAGGGSNKPLSEQTYEKIPIQEVQFGFENGETYHLKTENIDLFDSELDYNSNPTVYGNNSDSPLTYIYYSTRTLNGNSVRALCAYGGSSLNYENICYTEETGWIKDPTSNVITGNTPLTNAEKEYLYIVMDTSKIYNDDLLRDILAEDVPQDQFVTTGYTKINLRQKNNDLKNWEYEIDEPSLLKAPKWDILIDNYDSFIRGQSSTTVYIYADTITYASTNHITLYKGSNEDNTNYYYLTYEIYDDEEETYDGYYYMYHNYKGEITNDKWLNEDNAPINGVPPFTLDTDLINNNIAFSCIYGQNFITLKDKLDSIESSTNEPTDDLLKDKIYDETTETTGLVDGETYDFKTNMGFSSTDDDLGSLQPDDYIYDDGTKNIQFVIETDFLSRTFAYLVYTDDSETSYYYTVAQLVSGDPEFINEWPDGTVPSIQVDLSGIINENIFAKMLDVEISTTTVQKTLEQKLSEFKTWIYGYKAGGTAALENKTYNVKMADIDIDFTNASNNQQIALGSDGTELVFFNFSYNNLLSLNLYSNSQNLDLYYRPEWNCWKTANGTNYTGEQLTFAVNTSNVADETTLREIIEIEAGEGETPVTLEERIETPLKTWTYDNQEGGSGSGETSIKPIFDSLPILLGNIQTFGDSGLLDTNYTREPLYQSQLNAIAWNYNTTSRVIKIDYMIPDFDNNVVTVYENIITPTGQNTGTSEWDVHVEPFEPTGDELYEVTPITSQDELPVFENFDATQAESGYSDVVALLVGEVTSSGSSSGGSITLEQKIADLKNWTYENTPESDKFYTTPKWTDILAYITGDLIQLSTYTVYEKENENGPWDYIEVNYDTNNSDLAVTALFNGDMYKCFNYQYTESTSGDECDADTWYAVTVSYGPGQNPGEPGPAVYSYTELTTLPNLTIDSTAIENSDLFGYIVEHTDAVILTLDQKIESIGTFSGDYNDLSNKPDLSIYAETADLGTASTVDVGTSAGNIPVLNSNGKLPDSVMPALSISETFVVNSQASMLALTAQQGDVCVRTDLNKSYILTNNTPGTLANWQELLTPTCPVTSVQGRTGAVTITQADLNIIYSSTEPQNVTTGCIWIKPAN